MEFEESRTSSKRVDQSSRRRKGPAFLPSEHDDLPPGVAFLTLPASSQQNPITALDFSEPYGTLVTAVVDDDDPSPRVWDMLSIEEIGRLKGHKGPVRVLQVEDHVCLTGGEDGAVRVWDLRHVGENDTDFVSLPNISEEEDEASTSSVRSGSASDANGTSEDSACARVLEGHSKAVTALYFEENCLVTGASDKTLRQWDLATGQCVMTMDILWAMSHPPTATSSSGTAASMSMSMMADSGSASMSSIVSEVPFQMPPRADGSWDIYQDFVGAVQFWGYGLVSGSGDGAVRLWDSKFDLEVVLRVF